MGVGDAVLPPVDQWLGHQTGGVQPLAPNCILIAAIAGIDSTFGRVQAVLHMSLYFVFITTRKIVTLF
jgi:hypothetical protein